MAGDYKPPFTHSKQQRRCLRCQKKFASGGSWNRICGKCKERNNRAFVACGLRVYGGGDGQEFYAVDSAK